MTPYAFHEVHNLVGQLKEPLDARSGLARYLCAMFAELAYYHVPQWELDDRKRAMVVPSEGYRKIVSSGALVEMLQVFQQLDIGRQFVIEGRGVIVIGAVVNNVLFVAFRGTRFLFDWRINVRARLLRLGHSYLFGHPIGGAPTGRLHSGFAEEAIYICPKIVEAIRALKIETFDQIFLTGHSLGGAVAAISHDLIHFGPTSICVFGAPRYCDLATYFNLIGEAPTQIRRSGDMVPAVPPKFLGYADHPNEFAIDGKFYCGPAFDDSCLVDFNRWYWFLRGRFTQHDVELYRKELGAVAGAISSQSDLIPARKLRTTDLTGVSAST